MRKRFDVIALHFTKKCNLECPMCYRERDDGKGLPKQFFIDMVPHIAELSEQVAVGGGEPLMFPNFIRKFGKACKENGLIFNFTTNGTLIEETPDDVFENVTMVSISFDRWKITKKDDLIRYYRAVKRLNKLGVKVGANLLVDKETLNRGMLVPTVDLLFRKMGVERVFALCPKNWEIGNMLEHRVEYLYLTMKYKHFYVDDLTNIILKEKSYSGWKGSCHFGKNIVSIDEMGRIHGCSFEEDSVLDLKRPEDLLKIRDIKIEERFECPFLKKQKKKQ